MNPAFVRDGDRITMRLDRIEIEVVRAAHEGLNAALGRVDPDDAVVQRLFPQAVEGDEIADGEVRRMIHDELLAERLSGLDDLLAILDRGQVRRGVLEVDLVDEEPVVVLGVLNDLRLAIGARIGIEDLDRDQVDPEDPIAYRLAVMDHLGGLQEQLLAVLDPPSTSVYDDLGPEDLA